MKYERYFGLIAVSFGGIFASFWVVVGVEGFLMIGRDQKDKSEFDFWSTIWAFLLFAVFVIICVWAAWKYLPVWYPKPELAGKRGDMFGGVTALFSGLAFAGLISTLLMQRRELELQRNELKQTRKNFELQRFENTLFGLLKMFNDHVISLDDTAYSGSSEHISGRKVLSKFARKITEEIAHKRANFQKDPTDEFAPPKSDPQHVDLTETIKIYEDMYSSSFEADLGPYYRILYNIIRTIEHADLTHNDQLTYSKIVRAYLSSSEVKLLMFNCASKHGEGFKCWVIKHRMLKHLDPQDAKGNTDLLKFYGSEAFDGIFDALL